MNRQDMRLRKKLPMKDFNFAFSSSSLKNRGPVVLKYEGKSESSGTFLWKVTRSISMSEVDTGLTLNLS